MRILTGTIAWRLVLWFLILSTLPIAVMAVFVRRNVSDAFVDLVALDAQNQARTIAVALSAVRDRSEVDEILSQTSRGTKSIMYYDETGGVSYFSDGRSIDVLEASGIDFQVPRAVLAADAGSFVDATSQRVFAHAPVPGGKAAVVLATEPDLIRLPMSDIERTSVVQLALSLAVVAAAGGVVIWLVIGPIHRLTDAAEAIGAGDLDVRIDDDEMEGELLVLTRSFNHMAGQLQASYAQLEQQVADRTRELSILNRLAAVVGRSLDSDAMLDEALTAVLSQLGFDAGAICLPDDNSDGFRLVRSEGFSDELCALPPWTDMVSNVARTAQPRVHRAADPVDRLPEEATDVGVRVTAVVPLLAQGQVEGVLIVASMQDRDVPAPEIELLMSVGHQIGVGLQNRGLHGQAKQLAVLEERQRLARDLHDSVTQSLYGVTLYAEAAERRAGAGELQMCIEHLKDTRDAARSALREMRLLIYELRPAELDEVGLAGALRTRLELVEGRAGVGTAMDLEEGLALDPAVETELYHIAQEALNNALKHAQARTVRVALLRPEGTWTVRLEVADDGVGMDLDEARAHAGLGLRSMSERAARIGGTLTIDSSPGNGTLVRLELPL